MFIFCIIIFLSLPSFAFLDFIGEQAKKATEVAMYIDAATELASEVSPDTDLENGAKDIQRRSEALRSEASSLRYVSRSTQSLLNGPDWSSRRLDANIKTTTSYIRRLKSLFLRAVALGTDGVVALNTTETNVALNEIQKNQQAMILQTTNAQLRDFEREQEESRQWSKFSEQQRKIRTREVTHGKL